MFDFFIRFNPGRQETISLQDPFSGIAAYTDLEFTSKAGSEKDLQWVYLERKKINPEDFYSDPRFTVFIFGYLFHREENSATISKRFTASEVKEWISAGRTIDEKHFKGSYSVIIYRQENGSLEVITDPLNVRQVFYSELQGSLVLSSSLDAVVSFMKSTGIIPVLNKVAILQHLVLDFILDDDTFIEGVDVVPPGHRMIADGSGIDIKKYWDIYEQFVIDKPVYSSSESIRKINSYLQQHIQNYIDTPDNSAVALTGGYDSRTLTALLRERAVKYSYFSYGYGLSWDMSIPKNIAEKTGLSFKTFLLDKEFKEQFSENANLALSLSNGTAIFPQANIPYMYANHFRDKTSILSGLFGSELIKYPSGRGLFVDEAMFNLLTTNDFETSCKILPDLIPEQYAEWKADRSLMQAFIQSVASHKAFSRERSTEKRFFYYLLTIGARKYFAKEIAMERPFLDNLHPFWDVGFIQLLTKTPFSWVFLPWSTKKRFWINLKLHELYGQLIKNNNKTLSKFISTHAIRPIYLTSKLYYPLIVLDYIYYRKKIKKETITFQKEIIDEYIKCNIQRTTIHSLNINLSRKQLIKIISLSIWLEMNDLIAPY